VAVGAVVVGLACGVAVGATVAVGVGVDARQAATSRISTETNKIHLYLVIVILLIK
jgi:hypothetical protein